MSEEMRVKLPSTSRASLGRSAISTYVPKRQSAYRNLCQTDLPSPNSSFRTSELPDFRTFELSILSPLYTTVAYSLSTRSYSCNNSINSELLAGSYIMPRPSINIDIYQDSIEHWILVDRMSIQEAIDALHQNYGVTVTRRTLARRLAQWKVSKRSRLSFNADTELHARLITLFSKWPLKDTELLQILHADGYTQLSLSRLSELRKSLGLYKRVIPSQEEEVDTQIRTALKHEFDTGVITNYNREHLYAYIRDKYHIVGR